MTNHRGAFLNRNLEKPDLLRKPDNYSVDGIYDESLRDRAFEPDIDSAAQVTIQINAAIAAVFDDPILNGGPGLVPNGTGNDQALTVADTAGGVSFAAFPADTTHVLITNDTAEIRYTIDGSAPTTTNGHILAIAEERVWHVLMAAAMKAIRTGGTSGYLHASPLKAV